MSIIRYTKDATIRYSYLNIFPDQFKTEKEKQDESWIKNTMDYFSNKAYAEYVKNRDTFVKNYDLVKGILRMEDFYQEPEVKSFTEMLLQNVELPAYVKHYSIITTPINELVGEISKRPDTRILAWSGYEFHVLKRSKYMREALEFVDVIVCGRYIDEWNCHGQNIPDH